MNWNRHGASLWKGMKWLLYAEIVAIGAGYYVWHKMNVSEGKYIHSDSKQSSNNEYTSPTTFSIKTFKQYSKQQQFPEG